MKKNRLDFIDFAKGFAILFITVFHYTQPYAIGVWSKLIMFGGAGVHLFFIISSFGLSLSSKQLGVIEFYKQRFLKILLPYYIVVLFVYAINMLLPIYPENSLYALGGHLFLYKMFDENIMTSFGYHFWFMSTIIQFYLAYPFIMKLRNKVSSTQFIIVSLIISLIYWVIISVLNLSILHKLI